MSDPPPASTRIVSAAVDEPVEPVRGRQLSERDQLALLELLRNPPEPNEALMRAARHYRERYGS